MRGMRAHFSIFSEYEDLLERFSSVHKALSVLTYVLRFVKNSHPRRKLLHHNSTTVLYPQKIKSVWTRLAIVTRKLHFGEEYMCLLHKRMLPSSSSPLPLNTILDSEGVTLN